MDNIILDIDYTLQCYKDAIAGGDYLRANIYWGEIESNIHVSGIPKHLVSEFEQLESEREFAKEFALSFRNLPAQCNKYKNRNL